MRERQKGRGFLLMTVLIRAPGCFTVTHQICIRKEGRKLSVLIDDKAQCMHRAHCAELWTNSPIPLQLGLGIQSWED